MTRHTRLTYPIAAIVLALGLIVGPATRTSAQVGVIYFCGGKIATIVGTANNDILDGTALADVIVGLDGLGRVLSCGRLPGVAGRVVRAEAG